MDKLKKSGVFAGVFLVVLTAVAIIGVVLTNQVLKTRIEAAQLYTLQQQLKTVLPLADTLRPLEGETFDNVVVAYEAGNGTGYVFEVVDSGYGGAMRVLVGITTEGAIAGINVLEHAETLGVGTKTTEPAYLAQYTGIAGDSVREVDGISAATVSSNALKRALTTAYSAFAQYTGADATTEATTDATTGATAEASGSATEQEVKE